MMKIKTGYPNNPEVDVDVDIMNFGIQDFIRITSSIDLHPIEDDLDRPEILDESYYQIARDLLNWEFNKCELDERDSRCMEIRLIR